MKWGAAVCCVLLLAGCSSSGGGSQRDEVSYGTPAAQIAKQLGICTQPEHGSGGTVRCVFPGGIIIVSGIAGPADQEQELPADRAIEFCTLVGHGFAITGTSWSELHKLVDVNGIVARYGGKFAGGMC